MSFLALVLTCSAAIASTGHDVIPDFSRVGYHYSDEPIPHVGVKAVIDMKSVKKGLRSHADTTAYIQSVIDEVGRKGGGAVLIKKGTYNISRTLFIDSDNVVLRGEDKEGTVILSHGALMKPAVAIGSTVPYSGGKNKIDMGGRSMKVSRLKAATVGGSKSFGTVFLERVEPDAVKRKLDKKHAANITDDCVYVGSLGVNVDNPYFFRKGDRVVIFRPQTEQWISDLYMDRIASNGRAHLNADVRQWDKRNFNFYYERIVTGVDGNTVFFDAPVVMQLDSKYGGGQVIPCSMERVRECGVENITFDSTFDPEVLHNGVMVDEKHTWTAVMITSAEHCWVKDVVSRHMGYALADIKSGGRNITVTGCTFLEPVSVITGARRYAFCLSGGELCLFKDCVCDHDRHGYVTNGSVCGPNVYTNCKGTNMHSVIGPHQVFATGCLFDCIETDHSLEVQDRGNYGTGHGWAGANFVFWNCKAADGKGSFVCQSPWVSAKNYAVGSICKKITGRNYEKNYFGKPEPDPVIEMFGKGPNGESRPDGEWFPAREYGSTGGEFVRLPLDPSMGEAPEWWPVLSKTEFTNPYSLFECQLEDRHSKGIYIYQEK